MHHGSYNYELVHWCACSCQGNSGSSKERANSFAGKKDKESEEATINFSSSFRCSTLPEIGIKKA